VSLFSKPGRVSVWGANKAGARVVPGVTGRAMRQALREHNEGIAATKLRHKRSTHTLRSGDKVVVEILPGPDGPGVAGVMIVTTFKGRNAQALALTYSIHCSGPNVKVWGP